MTDIYFPGKVGVLWEHYFLNQLDTPVVIYAQTLGPLERSPYRRMTKTVLDMAAVIITRDAKSKAVVEELGVSTPIHHTADAAFAMDADVDTETLLDKIGTDDTLPAGEETTVSISVRKWTHTEEGTTVDDYAQIIADVADWLIREKDVKVAFVSTCTGLAGYHKDDRLVAAQVVEMMDRDDRTQIFGGEYTPQQLVRVYEKMDLHVGMRMHSNILAMLAETPIVAIQYQFKTRGLMEMFGFREYMIDIGDVDRPSLQRIVDEAFENRAELVDTLQSELPAIQEQSRHSARLVEDHLENGQ